MSGETASFLAGGEFPVPTVQSGGGGGQGNGSTAITVEWKPFGVSLAFTPTVLADGVINMVVAPEVSSIDPTASIVINNLTIPGLQTRRAKTVVELRDGESFALAGLLRKDFQDTIRQVPLLGSLPIIGTLFRSTGFQHEETELVIIVTPRLIRPVRGGRVQIADRPRRAAQRGGSAAQWPDRHRRAALVRAVRFSAAAAAAAGDGRSADRQWWNGADQTNGF